MNVGSNWFNISYMYFFIGYFFRAVVMMLTVAIFHASALASVFSIQEVGKLKLDGIVNGITLAGDYAYAATCGTNYSSSRLEVIDIKDSANLEVIGTLKIPNCVGRVTVLGNYAYVYGRSTDGGEFKVIDIIDPRNPILVESQNIGSQISGIAVMKNFAYITDRGRDIGIYNKKNSYLLRRNHKRGVGLKIFDIKNPITPTLVGGLDLSGELLGLAISKNYAYVIDMGIIHGKYRTDGIYEDAGLKIIDIKNPKHPSVISNFKAYKIFGKPVVVENYVYILESATSSKGKSELKILNVSNPAVPTLVGNLKIDVSSGQVEAVNDTYAYISYYGCSQQSGKFSEDNGIKIINIADPEHPLLVGDLKIDDFVNEIAIAGKYMYVANGRKGIKIYSIGCPSSKRV
jgi:hypothetical protein